MPNEWNLRYDAWIIADGEPNRNVGEVFDWYAVEFFSTEGLAAAQEKSKSVVPVADYEYQVAAELIYLSEQTCIIDFGIRAIAHIRNLHSGCKQGDYVAGNIAIGLPVVIENAPEDFLKTLERRWRVNRISADLTPYSRETCMRDGSRVQYQEVNSTDSINAISYVLHCSEIP